MKTTTALGVAFGILVLATTAILLEAWVLGWILSWFGVSLAFWQNLVIIFLANAIFKPTGGSK